MSRGGGALCVCIQVCICVCGVLGFGLWGPMHGQRAQSSPGKPTHLIIVARYLDDDAFSMYLHHAISILRQPIQSRSMKGRSDLVLHKQISHSLIANECRPWLSVLTVFIKSFALCTIGEWPSVPMDIKAFLILGCYPGKQYICSWDQRKTNVQSTLYTFEKTQQWAQ